MRRDSQYLLVFFLSGFSALIYQVIWARKLQLAFGVSAFAVAAVLSAYFLGLACGSYLGGRLSDRISNSARAYGIAEILIGGIAIVITPWLSSLDILLRPFNTLVLDNYWLLQGLRFIATLAVLFVPATLLGATFPLLLKGVTSTIGTAGRKVSVFYATNTFGAAAGVLVSAFYLIPRVGLQASTLLAAGLSMFAGVAAILISRAQTRQEAASDAPAFSSEGEQELVHNSPYMTDTISPKVVLVVMSVSGGMALGLEVLWTRLLIQSMSSTAYAFAILLATFLIGIALGSAWVKQYVDVWARLAEKLAFCQVAIAVFTLLGPIILLEFAPQLLSLIGNAAGLDLMKWNFEIWSIWSAIILLPTAVVFGIMFPLAARLMARRLSNLGSALGNLYMANTLGGVFGSFLFGFVFVPVLGLHKSMLITIFVQLLLAITLVLAHRPVKPAMIRIAIPVCVTILLVFIVPENPTGMLMRSRVSGEILHQTEDYYGTIIVSREKRQSGDYLRLSVNGAPYSDTGPYGLRYMRLQAHIPAILSGHPKKGLVIGLGVGTTAGALAAYPGIELTVVELSKAVVDVHPYFMASSGDLLARPNVHAVVDDGRNYLLRNNRERFDVITLEPPPPTHAGMANLYSQEFYKLMKDRLTENGVAAQWIPLHTQSEEETRTLIASFISVFPEASLWLTESAETLLTGTRSRISFPENHLPSVYSIPRIAGNLADVGISDPPELAGTFLMDAKGLRDYVNNAFIMTDDKPVIEYRVPGINLKYRETLENMLVYRGSLSRAASMLGISREHIPEIQTHRSELINQSLSRSMSFQ